MRKILRIRSILKSRNLKLEDLAKMLGINKVSLSAMLNGNPTLDSLEKIASVLNVPLVKLFYSMENTNYEMSSSDFNNTMIYKDEHVFLSGFLPHLTSDGGGSFCLNMKSYNFSILPDTKQIDDLIQNEGLESSIFKGDHEGKIVIQYCGTLTALHPDEHLSFCSALYAYRKCYQECQHEIEKTLGVQNFKQHDNSDDYIIGEIECSLWDKLIRLTDKYDLSKNRTDFEEFNATGNAIIMYNRSIQNGYNIKMWLVPIAKKYDDDKIDIGWRSPGGLNNAKILSGEIFTANQSYKFLHDVLIPKARKLR